MYGITHPYIIMPSLLVLLGVYTFVKTRNKTKDTTNTFSVAEKQYQVSDLPDLLQDTHIRKRELATSATIGWWQGLLVGFRLFFVFYDIVHLSNVDLNRVSKFMRSKKGTSEYRRISQYALKSLGFSDKSDPKFINYLQSVGHSMDAHEVGLKRLLKRQTDIHSGDRVVEKLLTLIPPKQKNIKDKVVAYRWFSYGVNSMHLLSRYWKTVGGMSLIRNLRAPSDVISVHLNWEDWIESYSEDLIAEIRQMIKEYLEEGKHNE